MVCIPWYYESGGNCNGYHSLSFAVEGRGMFFLVALKKKSWLI